MQLLSGQGQTNKNLGNRTRTIAVIAICLFGLAGLLSGFALGAFLHSGSQTQNGGPGSAISQTQIAQTRTPTHPKRSHPVELAFPLIDTNVSTSLVADGTTLYTFSAQAIDASHNSPEIASDITCKLWLVQLIPGGSKLDISDQILHNINNIQNPIPGIIDGRSAPEVSGLMFDANSPQTRYCNAHGKGNWKYRVSSSVQPGPYDLVVLTDWQGLHYNWSWVNVNIRP